MFNQALPLSTSILTILSLLIICVFNQARPTHVDELRAWSISEMHNTLRQQVGWGPVNVENVFLGRRFTAKPLDFVESSLGWSVAHHHTTTLSHYHTTTTTIPLPYKHFTSSGC